MEAVGKDHALRDLAAKETFYGVDLYGEYVRTEREIPGALRKPP